MRWFTVIALLVGCVPAAVKPEAAAPLAVHEVPWNPQHVDVGAVSAVAESGDLLVLFGDKGASVFVGGANVATDASVTAWRTAGTLPAPDGSGTWIVGVDGKGTLYRLRARTSLEPVSARFGLGATPIRALGAIGGLRHAFLLEGSVAICEGPQLTRFDGAFAALAAGGETLAELFDRGVRVGGKGGDRTYALEGPRLLAVDPTGKTWVATERALYGDEGDRLKLRYVGERIDALAPAADGAWLTDGAALVKVGPQGFSRGFRASPRTRLAPAPNGDVWMLGEGAPLRLSLGADTWPAGLYQRVCATCHAKNGFDLSSEAAWKAKKALLRKRVIDDQDMPPAGTPMSAEDRAVVEAWTR
ncbi:MAG: cytochrome c [Myxococcales bacterium]|nr:cytochrome c [Myxococcales bacterium]